MSELSEAWMKNLVGSSVPLLCDMLEWALSEIGERSEYGSEIEVSMATAMKVLTQVKYPEFAYAPVFNVGLEAVIEDARGECSGPRPERGRPSLLWGLIYPQVRILDYRVDFLIVHSHGLEGFGGTVVECDGHDFHERTKEQAARDRARDRELQQMGFRVLRYTGSEIWRNPIECGIDAMETAHAVALDSEYARSLVAKGQPERAADPLRFVAKVARIQ